MLTVEFQLTDAFCSSICSNPIPEDRDNDSENDDNVCEVKAVGTPGLNCKRDVQSCTDKPIEGHYEGSDEIADDYRY